MCIVDRIRVLSKEKGISLTLLEQKLGFGNGTIGKWTKQNPSCDKLKLVADYLSVSIDYLVTGESCKEDLNVKEKELLIFFSKIDDNNKEKVIAKAETLAEIQEEQEREAERKRQEELAAKEAETLAASEAEPLTIRICYFESSVSAGTGNPVDAPHKIYIEVDDSPVARMADYAVRIQGDSMSPTYNNGDIIIVKLQDTINIGQIGIFNVNGDAFVKELGDGELISHNPDYENIKLGENDYVVCQGLVLGTV